MCVVNGRRMAGQGLLHSALTRYEKRRGAGKTLLNAGVAIPSTEARRGRLDLERVPD